MRGRGRVQSQYRAVAGRLQTSTAGRPPRRSPHLHRAHTRLAAKDLFTSDHLEQRPGGRFRWLMSTLLAAAVGALAIFVVIYGSSDEVESPHGLLPTLKRMSEEGAMPAPSTPRARQEGLKWQVPRTDRLQVTSGAATTRYTIHEMRRQRVAGRDKIYAKKYYRVIGKLTPVPGGYSDVIPSFIPFRLFANSNPVGYGDSDIDIPAGGTRKDVSIKVVELHGGILPEEDGQELAASEVEDLVERTEKAEDAAPFAPQAAPGAGGALAAGTPSAAGLEAVLNSTVLVKSTFDADDGPHDATESAKLTVKKVAPGDTLVKLLMSAGADQWQAMTMAEAAEKIFPPSAIAAGQEVEITLLPSLTQPDRMEPSRFTVNEVLEGAKEHKVTVARNSAGEFVASKKMPEAVETKSAADVEMTASASLYSSIYYTGLVQQVPSDTIQQILKVHAYDTDFRRRIRAGDQIELFFDPKEHADDGSPGDLLYTAITAGGETYRFYRFRTSEGAVDFYDAQGNNSKKFLMRKPVRGDVRLTSGYGVRYHPLLGDRKMHTGVDWAGPTGTPILAAGNGTIEEAKRKGQYGNYVRIKHANGYQTAYGHMSRIGEGVAEGVKVRQGQTIGYIGSTGLSSGPHLHFEVLVNTRFVDPMSIQVPRERQLDGRELLDFQKERARIDDLMRRAPVKTETTPSR